MGAGLVIKYCNDSIAFSARRCNELLAGGSADRLDDRADREKKRVQSQLSDITPIRNTGRNKLLLAYTGLQTL